MPRDMPTGPATKVPDLASPVEAPALAPVTEDPADFDRGVSVNLLTDESLRDYLERLLPIDEVLRASP